MNQKITLRFADHVLTFEVPGEEVTEIRLAFRRKWPYKFVRANGDFHVSFDQVLWMKVSPGDDVETEREAAQEEAHILFECPPADVLLTLSTTVDGDEHGNL